MADNVLFRCHIRYNRRMKNYFKVLAPIIWLLVITGCSGMQTSDAAQVQKSFANWRADYLVRAAQAGISAETLSRAKPFLTYSEKVVRLDQKQPEKVQTFAEYLAATVTSARIAKARQAYADHRDLLMQLTQTYGVPGDIIVALWAKESDFGRVQGNDNILSSLATLAYDGRRRAFFEGELTNALRMADRGIDPKNLTGSWAGAMGQCQFMPSSYLKYAVDGDGDGRADIWHNDADALASIANYLRQNGWNANLPVAETTTIPQDFDIKLITNKVEMTTQQWYQMNVVGQNGTDDPAVLSAITTVVQPDGPGAQAYLAYDNYRVLMRWNRSSYFVLSVATLASEINP